MLHGNCGSAAIFLPGHFGGMHNGYNPSVMHHEEPVRWQCVIGNVTQPYSCCVGADGSYN